MSTAALRHDAFAPKRPGGLGRALALAVAAHVLLVIALTFHLQWKTSEPAGIEAELWSAVPQQAAPRAAAPEPAPAPQPPPQPKPEPQPAPPPAPRVEPPAPRIDPEIALEKARQQKAREDAERRAVEAAKQREQQQKERQAERLRDQQQQKAERERQEKLAQQAEAEQKKRDAERAKQDARSLAAARDAQLARMSRMAGQAEGSDSATATGSAARTSGPSAGYAGRIKARVMPNILAIESFTGNPTAVVEVRTSPDGTIIGRRITKSSGNPQWDDTVLRAIDKTAVLPRDTDGRVPSPMLLELRPRE